MLFDNKSTENVTNVCDEEELMLSDIFAFNFDTKIHYNVDFFGILAFSIIIAQYFKIHFSFVR